MVYLGLRKATRRFAAGMSDGSDKRCLSASIRGFVTDPLGPLSDTTLVAGIAHDQLEMLYGERTRVW